MGVLGWAMDITEHKRVEKALQERILVLTQPVDDSAPPRFEDLFDVEEIQKIQDAFSDAMGVASVITDIHGVFITRPSNFCRLCLDIIRKTPVGMANCMHSDAELGKKMPTGPIVQRCLSGGLWDGGTSICVGEHHIANWLVGQILEDGSIEDKMLDFGRVIGADMDAYRQALGEVTRMPRSQFEKICQALYLIARQLSSSALQNVQQGRFIAERRKVEEDLARERTLLRTIINIIPDSVYIKDKQGRKTIANPADLAFIGAREEEVIGKTDAEVYPLESANRYKSDDEWVIKNGQPIINKEEKIPKRDGSLRWLLTSKVPLKDNDGNIIGVVGIGRDISDRKEADEEIRRLNAELEERVLSRTAELEIAVRELETFSYSVSHDLRAPLRAINGFSLALLEDKADALDDEGKSHLNRIIQSTKRMSKIVDDLLKLSKVTQVEMSREEIDLGSVARSILDDFKMGAPERKVEVIIEAGMIVLGDTSLIRILMENLLNNAWKFTSKREMAHIEVGKTELEEKAVYYVQDNGAGFDMAYASRLFNAFQRLHTPAEFEGTGIGLATVGRIIKRHGGKVWALSAVDQGSTFYFMLG